ncbi:MAG: hypothetical protein KAI45_06100 [Melioribacteraceae bacterium]|nr:hypothetical protein [Melioribacteraceae bacterium]
MVKENKNIISYGKYIISWITLILLVVLQVVLSGVNLGANSNFITLLLASVAAFVIISVYMTDRSNKFISNIFKGIIVAEILIVVLLDLLI